MSDPRRDRFLRKWRTPICLLLGLAAIDLAVRGSADVWERHSPDDYAERVNGCASRPRDFVLVGGSPVSEGLRPGNLTGLRWESRELTDGYAVGLPGATTSEVYHAVLRSCPVPPKLLVYGITASDLNDARNEPHGPCSLMTWGDLRTWVRERPESAEWVTRHFLQGRLSRVWATFHYRHGIRMWAALRADQFLPGCCPEAVREARELTSYADAMGAGRGYAPAAGFVEQNYAHVKEVGAETPPFAFLDKYRTGSHLKYLHRLIDWAGQHQVAVVLVDMPITADLEAEYAEAFAEYRARLAEVERERGVVRVIRASRAAVGLDDTDFADLIHLNGRGAEKLSLWLRGELERVGDRSPEDLLAAYDRPGGDRP